jgi:hypothetical protein
MVIINYLQCQQHLIASQGLWAIAVELLNIRVSKQLLTWYQSPQDLGARNSRFSIYMMYTLIFVERC